MNRKIEHNLVHAIEQIRLGSATIEEILAQPEARDPEFEPLLRLALRIKPVEDLEPSPAITQALRERIMSDIARETLAGSTASSPSLWKRLSFARAVAVPAATVILILALAGGSVYASQDSLPGDALYGIKIAAEQAQLSLALSPEAKVDSLMQAAQKRTQEIARERRGRPDDIQDLAKRYELSIQQALQIANGMNDDANKEIVVERLLDNLERHQVHLQEVYDKVPEQAKDAVLHAKEQSRHGLETAASMVGKGKPSGKSGGKNEPNSTTAPAQDPKGASAAPSAPTATPRNPGQGEPATGSNRGKDEKELPGPAAKPKPAPGGERDR